jgi:archaellum component FlaG (FlaF/FlaG flagellin family)
MLPPSRKPSFAALLLCAFAFCLAAPLQAKADTVIYSNFGPNMTYNAPTGRQVTGTNFGGNVYAVSFTLTGNFTFTSAQLAISYILNGTNQLQVSLATNAPFNQPGTILETITLNNAVTSRSSVVTATSTTNTLLKAGDVYWLIARAPANDTFMAWRDSLADVSNNGSNFVYNQSHSQTGPWTRSLGARPAFQINGNPVTTAVPEPATLLLLGTGLSGAGAAARRRSARRPSSD